MTKQEAIEKVKEYRDGGMVWVKINEVENIINSICEKPDATTAPVKDTRSERYLGRKIKYNSFINNQRYVCQFLFSMENNKYCFIARRDKTADEIDAMISSGEAEWV